MGSQPSSLEVALDELYTIELQSCCTQHKLLNEANPQLFGELMEIFSEYKDKYRWAEDIPLMMQKYFVNVLPSLRNHQIEFFYKALNVTMLSDCKQPKKDHQKSFYNLVSSNQYKVKSNLEASALLEQSILFEDDIVSKYSNNNRMEMSSIYRESIVNPQHHTYDSNTVIMNEAVFIENLPKKNQEELTLYIEFYKRFSMVLESLINSTAFVSLPLRHFELEMRHNRQRKRIQLSKRLEKNITPQNIPLVFRETQEGQKKRSTISYNQNLLLSMISHFVETYTDFIWCFYNLSKLQDLQTAKLIDSENIYNLLTDAVWNKVSWVGDRGWQYQELKIQLCLQSQKCPEQSLPENVIQMACSLPLSPLKHLKQITRIYRMVASLNKEMTADVLMLKYRRLFYEVAQRNKITGLLRMIEIVNRLWKGQKFGEVGYAWTTWQAALEVAGRSVKDISLISLLNNMQNSKNQIGVFEID